MKLAELSSILTGRGDVQVKIAISEWTSPRLFPGSHEKHKITSGSDPKAFKEASFESRGVSEKIVHEIDEFKTRTLECLREAGRHKKQEQKEDI